MSEADEIVLCDIYAAREVNTTGVSSQQLADAITAKGKTCRVISDFAEAAAYCTDVTPSDGIVLIMGAGDVVKVAEAAVQK